MPHYDSEEEPYEADAGNDEEYDDELHWSCAFPDRCLMPSPIHTRDECHTVEDAQAYYAEMEGIHP